MDGYCSEWGWEYAVVRKRGRTFHGASNAYVSFYMLSFFLSFYP